MPREEDMKLDELAVSSSNNRAATNTVDIARAISCTSDVQHRCAASAQSLPPRCRVARLFSFQPELFCVLGIPPCGFGLSLARPEGLGIECEAEHSLWLCFDFVRQGRGSQRAFRVFVAYALCGI